MTAVYRRVMAVKIAMLAILLLIFSITSSKTYAQVTAYRQAIAEAAADDEALSAFYRLREYEPLWTSAADADRRSAFFGALQGAGHHGLPVSRYNAAQLIAAFRDVRSERDRGLLEVAMSRAFLSYANDIHTGALEPHRVEAGILREVPRRDRLMTLNAFAASSPTAFLRALPPQSPEYARLMKARLTLEKALDAGGWGAPVSAADLQPGDSGEQVVELRNRLIVMGYLKRSASRDYDALMQKAVTQAQIDNGLTPDGVATADTIDAINIPADARLQSVIVAMERERWINQPLGKRHIWVNLADFTAKIIDDGKVTFETRAVVGKNDPDTRSPEFSDMMEFMVINPTWNVPRSITVKEYLPMLQRNPNAAGHLLITDRYGREISRGAINFAAYNERTFPFAMSQPPSDGNALGLVKFMFPNPYNIYLHDTPQKALFEKEVRAYSHGCIRLGQPFDFAYALLAKQTDDPQGLFAKYLNTGVESVLPLQEPVPVHLDYRTAFTTAKGRLNYRRDVYGRDARIFQALTDEGLVLRAAEG